MSTRKRLMALAIISLSAIDGNASASDFKVMPGSACQPRRPSDREDVVALVDGITNIDPADPAFVVCPILRDNTSAGTNPNGILQVRLGIKKSSTGEGVSCLLDSYDIAGNRLERDEGLGGNGGLTLGVKQNPSNRGYYVIQCRLPQGSPGGTVVAYRYTEESPTDENN